MRRKCPRRPQLMDTQRNRCSGTYLEVFAFTAGPCLQSVGGLAKVGAESLYSGNGKLEIG